jgi:hypothetical protein
MKVAISQYVHGKLPAEKEGAGEQIQSGFQDRSPKEEL